MKSKIKYRINFAKAVEAILWLSNKQPRIDIYHIGKSIFYAEKLHLNKYGRPIIGDEYVRGEFGPFPSTIRDIIQLNRSWLNLESLAEISSAFSVEPIPYPTPVPKRKPNVDLFSETDIECLEVALKTYGPLSFGELKAASHDELCYMDTGPNEAIDYASMIDCDNPLRGAIIEEIEETHRYAVI